MLDNAAHGNIIEAKTACVKLYNMEDQSNLGVGGGGLRRPLVT